MIGRIVNWSRHQSDTSYNELEAYHGSQAELQKAAAAEYQAVLTRYLAGAASDEELAEAAAKAYGEQSASYRTHLRRLGRHYQESVLPEDPKIEEAVLNEISMYQNLVARIANARYNAALEARQIEWDMLQTDLRYKKEAWADAAGLILERGLEDFRSGEARLQEGWEAWQQRYQQEYERYAFLWADYWYGLQNDKLAWVEQATLAANTAADEVQLALLGDAALAAGRSAELNVIPQLQLEHNAGELLDSALASTGITSLFSAMESQNGAAATAASAVRSGVGGPSAWNSATIQVAASSFVREANKELAARQARLMAARTREQISANIESIQLMVKDANEGFNDSMDATWQMDGYWNISGSYYTKDVVVHSTLTDKYITERASVVRYRDFTAPSVEIKTDLSESTLQTLDADAIRALMGIIDDEVQAVRDEIFGKPVVKKEGEEEDKGTLIRDSKEVRVKKYGDPVTRYDEDGNEYTYTPFTWGTDTVTLAEAEWAYQKISPGQFGEHIGAAPIVKLQPNLEAGYDGIYEAASLNKGELGRLMAEYIYWSMKEGAGYAEANKPMYDKALWDSRGSWLPAPTIKDLVDVGVTIAATAITAPIGGIGGALLGAGIGLADDAVFALLDGTSGYKEWGEVGLEFGKKVAMAGVSVATAGMFNGFDAAIGSEAVGGMFGKTMGLMDYLPTSGIESVIGKTVLTGMQQVTNTIANSAINAVTWDAENGLGFSSEAMGAGIQSGMVGAVSSITSVFTGGMLSHFNATDSLMAGFNSANIGDVQRFNSFAGSMAGAGVTYAMTGNASFNILNASDLTGGRLQGGLFEMHVGKNGFSGRIGMGGTDLSLGTIAGALRGASVLGVNGAIGLYGRVNNVDAAVALRVQYGFGDRAQRGQLASILLGGTELELGGEANGEEAQTTTQNGRRMVHLAGYREGMSVEEQMRLAITLGHEAYRDGQYNGVAGQDQETIRAVHGHTAMMLRMGSDQRYAKMVTNMVNDDVGLRRDYEAYMNYANGGSADDYAAYVAGNYDSSADYWKVLSDGNIVFDGKKDLYDENGNLLRKYEGSGNGGWGASLGEHLGGLPWEIANAMMVAAGFDKLAENSDGEKYFVDKNGNDVTLDSNFSIQTSNEFKATYDFQMHYADQVFTKYGGNMQAAVADYKADIQLRLELGRLSGDIDPVALAGYGMAAGFSSFAGQYDTAISKYGAVGDTSDNSAAYRRIYESFKKMGQTDSNAMYSIINSTVFPVIGDSDNINIRTKAFYDKKDAWNIANGLAGEPHGQRFGGLGVDLGTMKNNYPVVTTQFETVLAQQGSYAWPAGSAGGLAFTSYSELFQQRYLHLQNNTAAQIMLTSLLNYSSNNDVFRFILPPGYQFGNVGSTTSTGLSSSEHLHYELNPYGWR